MNRVVSPSKLIKTDEDYNGESIKQSPLIHRNKPSIYSISKNPLQEQTDSMFPKIQPQRLKSSAALKRQNTGSKQALYRSIESNQKKSQQFDFSNIPKVGSVSQSSVMPQDGTRAVSALQKMRFSKGSTSLDQRRCFQFNQLPSIQSVVLGRQPGPNQIKRLIIDVVRKLQVEFDLQVVSRQLYINQQKIVQVMMMVSPPIKHASKIFYNSIYKDDIQMNYNCIQSKLYKLMMKSILDIKNFENTNEEIEQTSQQFRLRVLYVIELERFSQILQFLSIPINLGSLMILMQAIGCVGSDHECGVIINYAKLLWFIRIVVRQQQQSMDIYQNQSSTTAQTNSDQEDSSPETQFIADKINLVPKLNKTNQRKRVQFKIRRLGYLGKVNEFYDSYADLIKIVGNESNAKNYTFHGIRYSYVDLRKHPLIAQQDPDVHRETKVFGLEERSQLPIWIQAVYKHRVHQDQEVALTKVYYYLYKESLEDSTVNNQNEFIQIRKLLASTSQGNDMPQCKTSTIHPKKSTQNLDSKDIVYKPFFKEETENGGVDFYKAFDSEIQKIPPNEYQFDLTTEVALGQSDIENDFEQELTETPLFIKRIQSYPQLISERLFKLSFPIIDNYSYVKVFSNEEYMGQSNQICDYKIKSAFQQKENFVIQPKADNGKFQRHLSKVPDLVVDTDESDRELSDLPIDATGDSIPKKSEEPQTKLLSFLKSESSSVTGLDDLNKGLQKGAFSKILHQMEEMETLSIQEPSSWLSQRFLQHIRSDFSNSEINLNLEIKNFNLNGDTPVILKTLKNIENMKAMKSFKASYIESEEEPSFDEMPIQVKVPDATVLFDDETGPHSKFLDFEQEINVDPGQCCENIADVVDLPITLERGITEVSVNVKNGLVSSLEASGDSPWKMHFFLGERQRQNEPETYQVTMQGKQVKSIQINVFQKGNKIFMQSFCFLATIDQKIEEEQQKAFKLKQKQQRKGKQFQDETQEDRTFLKESEEELYVNEMIQSVNLTQKWYQGQFMVHIFYGRETEKLEDFNSNLNWLRQLLQKNFPEIIIVENDFETEDPECFESYIYGVGPVCKRDGNNRLILYRKDSIDWLQNFKQKSLLIIDILCAVISLYGNAQSMSVAQAKFLSEHLSKNSRSLLQRNSQYAYKYLEGIQERLVTRPITGTFRPKSSVKLNLRYQAP